MEHIGKDRGGDWYFDGNKTYFCKDKRGNIVGKIYREYIPDPEKLWASKLQQAGAERNSNDGAMLRPNPIVYKLWEHANANAD